MFLWLIAFWWVAGTDPLQQADLLFEQGNYASAVLEAKRYLYESPGGTERMRAYRRLGESYMRQADWEHARWAWQRLLKVFPSVPARPEIELDIGYTYLAEGEYAEGYRRLHQLAVSKPEGEVGPEAWVLSGWCALHQRDWYAGITEMRRAARHPDVPASLASLANRLADMTLQHASKGQRSPRIARRLSALLPGAGQVYGGRPLEGTGTLLLAATGGYLLVDAIRDERNVDAVGLALLLGWGYLLNVQRAESVTHHYEEQRDQEFLQQLRLTARRDGVGIGLEFLLSGNRNE